MSKGKYVQSVLHHTLLAYIYTEKLYPFLSHGKSEHKFSKYGKKSMLPYISTHTPAIPQNNN